jgi:DNA repair protein RadA/Sms
MAPAAQADTGGLEMAGFKSLGAFVDHLLGR